MTDITVDGGWVCRRKYVGNGVAVIRQWHPTAINEYRRAIVGNERGEDLVTGLPVLGAIIQHDVLVEVMATHRHTAPKIFAQWRVAGDVFQIERRGSLADCEGLIAYLFVCRAVQLPET
jgi:hypothetical protein